MKKISILFVVMIILTVGCFFSSCDIGLDNDFGEFYTLNDAYTKGLLTDNDLVQIADYYQGDKKDSLSTEFLDGAIKKQIIKCYLLNIINDLTISDKYINVYDYYCSYNGTIAIGITDTYYVYDKIVIPEYKIGNVIFYNFAESDIRIWVK